MTAPGLATTCARPARRHSRNCTKHLSRGAGASIGITQVWCRNEPEQAHAVAVGCELSVGVPEASACMGHDGLKRTADQAMGSHRPRVLCHEVACKWPGKDGGHTSGKGACVYVWPLWWSLSISSTLCVACCALILMMTVSSCSEKWHSNSLDPVAIFTVWRTVCWRGRCAGCRCDVAARRLVCAARCVVDFGGRSTLININEADSG